MQIPSLCQLTIPFVVDLGEIRQMLSTHLTADLALKYRGETKFRPLFHTDVKVRWNSSQEHKHVVFGPFVTKREMLTFGWFPVAPSMCHPTKFSTDVL